MMPVVPAPSAEKVPWRREPFRLFFPGAVLLGTIGAGHWLFYATGVATSYPGFFHGQVMMQAFMMALAAGFLMTAVPRRTKSAPPSVSELVFVGAALVSVTVAAIAGRPALAQLAYAALFLVLLQFAVRRFLGRESGRRPPASFVLVPIAVVYGLAGASLMALAASPMALALGRLFIEQGVFLCLAIGIGSMVIPIIGGAPPPADLGSSPRERGKLAAYALLGGALGMSMVLEAVGWMRGGPFLRAVLVGAGLVLGGGAARPPKKPGLHRRLVWLAAWLMPVGLAGAALAPDFRIAMLHVLFIGGFSLLGFAVATHVALEHLDLESLGSGWPPAVVVLAVCMVLAISVRVGADFSPRYLGHLGWASALWVAGAGVWLGFFGPRLLGHVPRAAAAPEHRLGPIAAYLAADHARLDALLARTIADPAALDMVAYDQFRRGLLRHIGMEEKILLPAAQRLRGGTALPEAARLRSDHGALTALVVPYPTPAVVGALRHILGVHNALEEGSGGVYAACEALAGAAGEALAAELRAAPEVPVRAPIADVRILEVTRRALARAGYDPALL